MAEAVDDGRCYKHDNRSRPSSVELFSDQVTDPWCDLCYDESSQFILAEGFCLKCNYFLCIPCTDAHKRHTRTHEIIRGEDMPRNHADKPVRYRDCAIHSGQVADQFCLDHSKMVCCECVPGKLHRPCQVSAIGTLSKRISKIHIQKFKDDAASIIQFARATTKALENNLSDIECQRTDMIEKADDVRDTNISIIRAVYSATITEINESCQQKASDIDAKMKSLAKIKHSLHDTIADIEKTSQPNLGPNEFIRIQELIEIICKYKNEIIEILNKFDRVDLSFCIDPRISKLLSNCNQFGHVEDTVSETTTIQPIPDIKFPRMAGDESKLTAKEKIELCAEKKSTLLISQQDGDNCEITGMAITKSGVLLIADKVKNKIKVYSSKNQLLSSFSFPGIPGKITVIDEKTAAVFGVSMFLIDIHFLDISDPANLTLQCNSSINRGLSLTASCDSLITTCGRNLVVLGDTDPLCVKLIDLNGEEQWSTSSNRKSVLGIKYDQKLFKHPVGIACKTENEKTTVVVTDSGKDTITILEASSGTVTKIITEKDGVLRGVTTDWEGNIYVAMGYKIKVWTSDLQTHRMVSLSNNSQGYPRDIIFDNSTGELLVSYGTNMVDRFQL